MEANESKVLSRVERTNKKLTKVEAREVINELARKRNERQIRSALNRQKGLIKGNSTSLVNHSSEGSQEFNKSGGVDAEEERALRLEKMREKNKAQGTNEQVFIFDWTNCRYLDYAKFFHILTGRHQQRAR